ncbi:MAG TPA: methylenetetrahydrofolate reductase [NAD(P)H] [Dehalococcoidales bacterium]|nr:methylenetetrahydrofolate reductase [NAD(P)H] [Dehalococcoidales bacterium]
MKIGDIIKARGGSLSFEFFPPKDAAAEARLFQTITKLKGYEPTFVSVTYGAGGGTLRNTRKVVMRIKGGTSLTPMPHLTCVEQSQKDLDNILKEYKKQGVENILALRGDPPRGTDKFVAHPEGYCYAIDLVRLVVMVGGYSIGVAVYPEGHSEAPDLETDLYYTKQKIDAGADFAITQMFFDNRFFYNFMERAEKAGISIPIIPGIMPITDIEKIKKFSQMTGATLPKSIVGPMEKAATPEEARKLGMEFATRQCEDLRQNGVKYFHFYTMNQSRAVTEIVNNLGFTKK